MDGWNTTFLLGRVIPKPEWSGDFGDTSLTFHQHLGNSQPTGKVAMKFAQLRCAKFFFPPTKSFPFAKVSGAWNWNSCGPFGWWMMGFGEKIGSIFFFFPPWILGVFKDSYFTWRFEKKLLKCDFARLKIRINIKQSPRRTNSWWMSLF